MGSSTPELGLHKEDIKAAVRKTGITLRQLALDNGLQEAATRLTLISPLPAADKAIAKCIGKKLHEIWPDRYDARGRRKRKPAGRKPAARTA